MLFANGDDQRYIQGAGELDQLWIVDVDVDVDGADADVRGGLLVIDAASQPGASREDRAELQAIVDSIEIEYMGGSWKADRARGVLGAPKQRDRCPCSPPTSGRTMSRSGRPAGAGKGPRASAHAWMEVLSGWDGRGDGSDWSCSSGLRSIAAKSPVAIGISAGCTRIGQPQA